MKTQQGIDFATQHATHAAEGRNGAAPLARRRRRRGGVGLAGLAAAIALVAVAVCAGIAPQGTVPAPGSALLSQADLLSTAPDANDPAAPEHESASAAAPAPGAALLTQEGLLDAASAIQAQAEAEAQAATAQAPAAPEAAPGSAPAAAQKSTSADLPAYREGVVLVEPAKGVDAAALQNALGSLDAVADASVSEDELSSGIAEVELAAGADEAAALQAIEQLPETAAAQPDFYYYLADSTASNPSNPSGNQSALGAASATKTQGDGFFIGVNDPLRYAQWNLDSVFADQAWEAIDNLVESSAKGLGEQDYVTVAVLDTGCDVSHEDLVGRITSDRFDAVTGSAAVSDIDSEGHGTHVSGVIAATANNGKGIAGLGYNKVKVLPIKVFDKVTAPDGSVVTQTSTSLIQRGLAYLDQVAKRNNVRVANLSFGASKLAAGGAEDEITLKALSESAAKNDILFVASAGNNGSATDSFMPGDLMNSGHIDGLSVIALDKNDNRISDSNYNAPGERKKELSAPAEAVISTVPAASSSAKYGKLDQAMSGTSVAAPMVSGVAALASLASQANGALPQSEPYLSAAHLKTVLKATAIDINADGFDEATGWGKVNAYDAVSQAANSNILEFLEAAEKAEEAAGTDPAAGSDPASPANPDTRPAADPTDNLDNATVTGVKTLTYNYGAEVRQSGIVVKTYSTNSRTWNTLKVDSDYVIKYENNKDATRKSGQKAIMTIEGKGAYRGQSKEVTFAIEPAQLGTGNYTWANDISNNWSEQKISSQGPVYTGEPLFLNLSGFKAWIERDNYVYNQLTGAPQYLASRYDLAVLTASTDSSSLIANGKPDEREADELYGARYDCVPVYANNVNAGLARVWLVGVGNFSGSVLKTFTINAADIASADFELVDSNGQPVDVVDYTGSAIQPKVEGWFESLGFEEGKDYTLTYESNRLPGTAKVNVAGHGNFMGTKTLEFDIVSGASLAKDGDDGTPDSLMKRAEFTVPDAVYSGKKIEPKPKVKLGTKSLKKNKDYELSYGANTTVKDSEDGNAYVTVTGIGNYADYGAKTVKFAINPVSIKKAKISGVKEKSLSEADKQNITVKFGGEALTAGTDYSTEICGASGPGTSVLVVRGLGNFQDAYTKSFKVTET